MRWLKQQLRQRLRAQRSQLDLVHQQSYSIQIAHFLFQKNYFRQAQHLALYLPFAGEVWTSLILEQALTLQKSCYVPVVINSRYLQFVKIDKQTPLAPNRFGILEPSLSGVVKMAQQLDVVLLPLVAFDAKCRRLGMGGGYYDATFRSHTTTPIQTPRPLLIGLAYEFQRVACVPHTKLDLILDEVVTEKRIYHRVTN